MIKNELLRSIVRNRKERKRKAIFIPCHEVTEVTEGCWHLRPSFVAEYPLGDAT